MTIDLIVQDGQFKYQANAKLTSCKFIEDQSHQDSRQRNQAQRSCSEIYEK